LDDVREGSDRKEKGLHWPNRRGGAAALMTLGKEKGSTLDMEVLAE
jgi:hypothetical protein